MSDIDITTLILSEHEAFRRSFTEIDGLTEPSELERRWTELADALEVHAAGEEEVFYPQLLQQVDDSQGDTRHAVHDHNEIRDAVRAVAGHQLGGEDWWEAFRSAREATVEHLGEEEADVLPPFRESVSSEQRDELGMRWLAFRDEHERAAGLPGTNKDPDEYVEQSAEPA